MPRLDPCDASAVENRSTGWLLSLYWPPVPLLVAGTGCSGTGITVLAS
jgi:hypothetical protein